MLGRVLFILLLMFAARAQQQPSPAACNITSLNKALQSLSLSPNSTVEAGKLVRDERVTCADDGSLLELDLHGLGIKGTLSDAWLNITTLVYLDLRSNQLRGTLPISWANWTQLRVLILGGNPLSGPLPSEWSSLSGLELLKLNESAYSGPLPEAWTAMKSLVMMELGYNNLSGPLWSTPFPSMQEFGLKGNAFSGTLPERWSEMNLSTLDLGYNDLHGTLPDGYSALSNMKSLWFDHNHLNGTLPASWATMQGLAALGVHFNQLEGTLPEEWSTMSSLGALDVANNLLSGTLPASYARQELIWYPVTYWDFSRNQLEGSVPPSWANISNLQYLGLHGNPKLCKDRSCLDIVASNWTSLRLISLDGGQPVHPNWCNVHLPDKEKAYVLYVDQTPSFDDCMHQICLSREPSDFLVGYMQDLHMNSAVSDLLDMEDEEIEERVGQGKNAIGDAVSSIVAISNTGWIVGDGGVHDPCVDPERFRNVIIAFSIFGALLLVLVVDGLLLYFGWDLIKYIMPCAPRQRSWWEARKQRVMGSAGSASNSNLVHVGMAMWAMRYSLAIVGDISLDIILLVQIIPLTVGYLLLASFLAGILASGLGVHLYLIKHAAKPASTVAAAAGPAPAPAAGKTWFHVVPNSSSSSSPDSAGPVVMPPMVLRMYNWLAQLPLLLQLLVSLLLLPFLAVVVDVMLATYFLFHLPAAVLSSWRRASSAGMGVERLLLGCLSPSRTFIMRSLVTVVLQSTASMAFTTWGYVVTRKYGVGQFITQTTFLLNLVSSMLHILLQAWHMKDLLVRHGSLARTLEDLFDLGPQGQGTSSQLAQDASQPAQDASQPASENLCKSLDICIVPGPPVESLDGLVQDAQGKDSVPVWHLNGKDT